MKRPLTDADNNSFLFQVEILATAETNGAALEQLLRVLNGGNFADFRVNSGIQLGRVIEQALAQEKKKTPAPAADPVRGPVDKAQVTAAVAKAKDAVAKAKPAPGSAQDELEQRIQNCIKTNQLIRLSVNKGRGVKLNIPGRIINFDRSAQVLTVYHVDEKQVHSFKLFEIDDFLE